MLEYFKLCTAPSFPSSLHPPVTPPTFPGALKARGMTFGGAAVRSGAPPPETSAPYYSPFGSTLPPSFGTVGVSQPGANMHQVAPPYSGTGMVPSVSVGGSPQVGFNMTPPCGGVGMVRSGSLQGDPLADPFALGAGRGQSSFFGGNLQAGGGRLGGSAPPAGGGVPVQPPSLSGSRNNPFLL